LGLKNFQSFYFIRLDTASKINWVGQQNNEIHPFGFLTADSFAERVLRSGPAVCPARRFQIGKRRND
jgi:hypothetical protein